MWLLALLWLTACSTIIQFSTQKTADPRFNGIRTVGVNTVLSATISNLELQDNSGNWTVQRKQTDVERLETLVRKSLVANLKRFSDYQVIDLHDLNKFQQAFQRLRPVSGERIGELDLLIDIRISLQAQQQNGNSQEIMTFHQQRSVTRGKKRVMVQDSSEEKVVTVPYSFSRVDFMCYVEVIKTRDGDAKVLKSFNALVSNSNDPYTSIETMINEMAIVITGRILKDVSKYAVVTTRAIDKDSDDDVVDLLEHANLNAAAARLESILADAKEKKPADLYNLGICYEAFGDPALAQQMYKEALRGDEDNERYMKAIGALE